MPAPNFQPRQHPELISLLHRILERLQSDVPNALGVAITAQDKREQPAVLAALGIEDEMVAAQFSGLSGPVADALTHQVPVLSLDLWTDDRWPELTFDSASSHVRREVTADLKAVHGAAAVPGFWRDDAAIALSCTLCEPASALTVTALIAYEQLVSSALVTTAAQNEAAFEDLLAAMQSRGAIEQAKGALMGLTGCDAEQAWSMLRRASQEFNVKLRELAVALLEQISGRPAQQPGVAEPIAPDAPARNAARLLWSALSKDAWRTDTP